MTHEPDHGAVLRDLLSARERENASGLSSRPVSLIASELAALRFALSAMKDAERLDWLVENTRMADFGFIVYPHSTHDPRSAIDAAMQEGSK